MTAATSITVRVPLTIRKRRGRKVPISPEGVAVPGAPRQATTTADLALLKALARAFRWKRMLDDGRYASVSDIARSEKIDRGYAGSILRLTLLSPGIVEAIVGGRQPVETGLPAPWPVEWEEQRAVLRNALSGTRCSTSQTDGQADMIECKP
jgi:hypothetical protein